MPNPKRRIISPSSALSYFGSDGEMAADLAAYLDYCQHVTIPFCAGLSILPYLLAHTIVANDKHEYVINFYRHVQGHYGKQAQQALLQRCSETLSHPEELRDAQEILQRHRRSGILPVQGSMECAWAIFTSCWVGRKGRGGTKAQMEDKNSVPSIRFGPEGGNNATRLAAAAIALRHWQREFKRCEFSCMDFRPLLLSVRDDPRCGIYCDPPWVDLGDVYEHAFTERDHRDLRDLLSKFHQTKIIIRYGDHPLVHELYQDWNICSAESRDQDNQMKPEVFITPKRKSISIAPKFAPPSRSDKPS